MARIFNGAHDGEDPATGNRPSFVETDAWRTNTIYQIELVEEQTGNMDPKTNFRLIIIQTELERFKFLVRSFLRARIAKVDFLDQTLWHCYD